MSDPEGYLSPALHGGVIISGWPEAWVRAYDTRRSKPPRGFVFSMEGFVMVALAINWLTDADQALQAAKQQSKAALLDFSAAPA